MESQLLSVSEVARQVKKSEQQVRNLLRSGKLRGERVGKSWVVPIDALDTSRTDVGDHSRSSEKSISSPVALSFFSGLLGLDLGLERAGFEILLASEIDARARESTTVNRPKMALIGDIRSYDARQIRSAAGLASGSTIDLIAGGPPCQAFSTAGKRLGLSDDRGNVFLKYIDLIGELQPNFAVIENVRGLLSAPMIVGDHETAGGVLASIVAKLKSFQYEVSFNLYNAANFGAPQIRERLVVICSKNGRVPYLTPTNSNDERFGLPKWQTFRQAVAGLETATHEYVCFPEKRLKYYRLLKSGQNWRDLPIDIQKQAMGMSWFSGGGKTGFYRRLAWDEPAPTLVTHPAMPATDLAHPSEDRPLSVQEYQRLQGFPDSWRVCGGVTDKYRQLGNAVPVPLGEAIGRAILHQMNGIKQKDFADFPYSRYRSTNDREFDLQRDSDKRKPQRLLFD